MKTRKICHAMISIELLINNMSFLAHFCPAFQQCSLQTLPPGNFFIVIVDVY